MCGGVKSSSQPDISESLSKPYYIFTQIDDKKNSDKKIIRDHGAPGSDMMTLGRRQQLLAQLHELHLLPSPTTTTPPVEVETIESGGPDHACDGRRRRRCRRGSKRPRDDDTTTNNGSSPSSGKKRSKKQESTCFVTSAPDFDGYRWRKYGQKQIEGAMYARSYYRCTRSAEQGCPAKRTVQRIDDDGAAPAEYTVVRIGEHTCTATDDSLAAPVILETTAIAAPDIIGTSKGGADEDDDDDTFTSAAHSCCSTTTTTGTGVESPAISDDTTWSSGDYNVVDDYGAGTTLLDVHDYSWSSSASLQGMEDFTGPIRSPVHVPQAAGCWSIDHFMLQLANNEPVSHYYFSSAC